MPTTTTTRMRLVMLTCALVLHLINQSVQEQRGMETGMAAGVLQATIANRACAALQHAKITCPAWDPAQEDGGVDVDLRVRWIHRHQNPSSKSCDEVNYLFRSHNDYIGFGADVYLMMVSTLYMALYSDRVFLVDGNVPFRYADCEPQSWQCYFLPLSRCTIADVEASVKNGRRAYGGDFLNASHHVIRASKVCGGKETRDCDVKRTE